MASKSWLPSLGAIFEALRRTALRFPLPLACALGFCLVTLFDVWSLAFSYFPEGDAEERLRILLFLGFFGTLATALFAERLKLAWWIALPGALAALALLGLRVFTLPALDSVWFEGYVLFLGPALVLLVMTLAFVFAAGPADSFWNFNRASWLGAAAGFLAALILAIGLTSAVYAIDTLFGVKTGGALAEVVWVTCLSVVWPILALIAIPERLGPENVGPENVGPKEVGETAPASCPQLLARLIGYLLVPLTLFYLAILYAYGAKILIDGVLPDGQVASLVAVYATFGAAVHLAAYPLRATGTLLARLYYRWFYPALLLPVVLFALAVWLRIDAYGITEQRYLLAVLALWLAAMTLWFWRKPDQGLVFIPFSLAVLLGLAAVGPWGAVAVSTKSQMSRLESLLSEHEILRDGVIVPTEAKLDWEDQKAVASIVDYLWGSGKREVLRLWFEDVGLQFKDTDSSAKVVTAMGLAYVSAWETKPTFNFNVSRHAPIPVIGFETLVDWGAWRWRDQSTAVQGPSGSYEVSLDSDMARLLVRNAKQQTVVFDLVALAQRLVDLPKEDHEQAMTLERTEGELTVRLHVTELSGSLTQELPDVAGFGAYILIAGPRR